MNQREYFEIIFSRPAVIAHVQRTAVSFNIDGRAIVGAVRWEIYFNRRGYLSDIVQFPLAAWNIRSGNGLGWGSMHWDVAESLQSTYQDDALIQICTASTPDIATCLNRADTATHMIAAEIARAADAYERIAGLFIRDRPEILAALYHLGKPEEKAAALVERRKSDPNAAPQVGSSAMGQYVRDNLHLLKAFHTQPVRSQRLPAVLEPQFQTTRFT